ncbi:glycoside hydrolase family 16 protein [Mycena albidolilacea]|uniref:Glycoside hydrolase family 16 protein n=1 Tax=Mycena albidolilacea TaxID=1033008 RepID=A0AAD7EG65_9AGAR|nr:glycoside hydrolase family 16 protein [Mycena albidolilacea]
MPSISTSLLVISLFLATASAAIPAMPGYHVGLGIDHSKWAQAVGPTGNNGELQVYTAGAGNVHLSGDGQLYIIPTKSGNTWYSGRIESMASQSCAAGGAMVFQAELWVPDFTGVPAKFAGLWPAFWTLGQNFRSGAGWPKCGEWDIFEVYNGLGTLNKGTIHFENPDGSRNDAFARLVNYAGGQYHTWAFKVDRRNPDWKQQKLTWYLDGTEYYSITGAQIGEFTQWTELAYNPYFVILNMAVGGDYPGYPTAQTIGGYDASLRVRYVAVYKTD